MRKLALAVAVALASGKAVALGLGEIKLHSALNEPLNAEIQLISDRPGEIDSAVVRLAPQDVFQQAGIEWPAVLGDLKFTVTQGGGGPIVKLTSTQPVREPFLDFIVQLQWPAGRVLREYTVLLDPPTFGADKAPPLAAPVVSPPAAAPAAPAAVVTPPPPAAAASAPRADQPRAAAPRPTAPAPAARSAPGTYGPTRRTDTAWAVAQQVRPDPSITVQQAMLALLEANPDAFYDHNVNNLLAGHVLRIPSRELMSAIAAQQAEREVSRQYQQWRQARSGTPAAATVPPQATAGVPAPTDGAAAPRKPDGDARLRLAAPGEAAKAVPGAGGQDIEKLRNDLAIALESADAARRENEELHSRLSALEGQINSMQRLLTLQDGTLAEMQGATGADGAEGQAPAAAPSAPEAAAPPAAAPAPAKPKPAVADEPEPAPDMFANPMLLAAAGGAALLLLAVALLAARRRRAAAESEEARFEPIVAQAAAEAAAQPRPSTAESTAYAAAAVEPPSPQMAAVADEVARGAEGGTAAVADELDVMHTAEGEIDPIVEADVYLAYRRYQQAEALIQNALAKQPDRLELKVKLLEIHYAARNTEAFQAVAEALHNDLWQHPDDALWQRVVAMGAELLPGHVLFSGGTAREPGAGGAMAGAGAALFTGAAVAAEGASPPPAPQDDFFGTDSAEVTAERRAAEGEQSLDLDLRSDDTAVTGGDGLGEMVGGLSGEVPDIDVGTEVRGTQAESIPDNKDWQVGPALSDFGSMDFNLDDTDFLAGTDVVGTKLDLARAYIDMGDGESAREILAEVLKEGSEQQKQEAQALAQQLG